MTAGYIVSFLGLAVIVKTLHFYITHHDAQESSGRQTPCSSNQVLFFPDTEFPCPAVVQGIARSPEKSSQLCKNPSCKKLHGRSSERASSLIEFLTYLAGAKRSVDLCIYLFTQGILADVLCDLHSRKNIKIRIITDSSEDDSQASQIERLRAYGIVIKSNRRGSGALMHHKFVIVDGETLLSGSFNWTNKAVVSNYEAVLVSSEPSLVGPFCDKFEELWRKFDLHPARK